MTAHPSAFALTVAPIRQQAAGSTAHITVTDAGTAKLAVSTSAVILHEKAGGCVTPHTKGVTVSPASFSVKPGHHVTVAVHLAPGLPAGDYGVAFSAAATGGDGAIHLDGAVGSQLVVGGAASTVHCARPHPVAAPAGSSGFPTGGLLILLAVVVVVTGASMTAFGRAWRRRRRPAAARLRKEPAKMPRPGRHPPARDGRGGFCMSEA
jgi:hypothetical protein